MVQHVIVIALVALCVAYVVRQAYVTLCGSRSRLGSCCARGCDAHDPLPAGKAHFIPSDALVRNRKGHA